MHTVYREFNYSLYIISDSNLVTILQLLQLLFTSSVDISLTYLHKLFDFAISVIFMSSSTSTTATKFNNFLQTRVISMTFKALKLLLLNSKTFQNQWQRCKYRYIKVMTDRWGQCIMQPPSYMDVRVM